MNGRRGLTLLEIVFAVVLLALATASVTGVLSMMARGRMYDEERSGAHEIANRLLLQYLDDPKGMPRRGAAIEYGRIRPHRFQWDLSLTPVELRYVKQAAAAETRDPSQARFRELTVVVYATLDKNGAVRGEELARLSRVYDPAYAGMFRNADVRDRAVGNMDRLSEVIKAITGAGDDVDLTGGGAGTPGAGAAQPVPGRPGAGGGRR